MTEISKIDDSRLATGKVCLIVTAPWCGMCRMMKPSFEKMADNGGDILFLTANADKVCEVASRYGVKSLPTAVLLSDGVQIVSLHGSDINSKNINSAF